MTEGGHGLGGLRRHAAAAEALEPGVELHMVRHVVLRIDVPDHGPRRPVCAHAGILAAHEVHVAGPEQLVVVFLPYERNHLEGQAALCQRCAGGRLRRRAAEPRSRLLRRRALRHQALHGRGAVAPLGEQGRQGGVGVGEQAHAQRVRQGLRAEPIPEGGLRGAAGQEGLTLGAQHRLPQQPARAVRKAGEEEVLHQRQLRMGRGQRMVLADPRLGAQVFQVDPYRRARRGGHRGQERLRQVAGECLDDEVVRRQRLE
ncbi:hypothetical protein D3C87_1284730 [compost metagenome]